MKHVDERRRTVWHRVKWATLSFKYYAKENFSSQNLNRDQKRPSSPNVSKQASEESVPCLFAPVTEILLFQSKISLGSMSNYKLCWTVGPPPVELFCSWLMSCSALKCESLPFSLSFVALPITKHPFISLMSENVGFLHFQ